MRKITVAALLGLAFVCVLSLQGQTAEDVATVTGRVLDAKGEPVEGATISIMARGGMSGVVPYVRTDKNGLYRLVSRPYGIAWLTAVKESAGYPDTNIFLYLPSNGVNPRSEVDLTPGSHLYLDFHLPPPNGIVEASVVDARTGAPVRNGRVRVSRDDLPIEVYSSGTLSPGGHFMFALPEVPISITVSAPGYTSWTYRDPLRKTDKLILASGDHRELTIELAAR